MHFDDATRDRDIYDPGFIAADELYALDGLNYPGNPSGYQTAVSSEPNVGYNGFARPVTFSCYNGVFDVHHMAMAPVWVDNLRVTITGYRPDGSIVQEIVILPSRWEKFLWTSGSFTGLSRFELKGTTPGGSRSWVAFDDICFTLPAGGC